MTQTPVDLGAMLALAVLAAAAARKIIIAVRPGWVEPVNLFVVSVLAPGNRKSAVESHITAPVVDFERQEAERRGPEIAKAAEERKIKEQRLQHLRSLAAKAKPDEAATHAAEARDLAALLAGTAVPECPRIFVDDITPERLATLLTLHDGRMAVFSAEGDLFDLMAARYGNAPNFGVYLRGHLGDELRVDQVNRPSEIVHRPAITLGLAVQPDVIASLSATKSLRGRGLLGRFIYSLPLSPLGRRRPDAPDIPATVAATYHVRVLALLRLPFGTNSFGQPAAQTLRLEPAATAALRAFEAWIEPQLADTGALGTMTDWAGKLVGTTARIAALLHLAARCTEVAPWESAITADTVLSAIRIAHYLIPHARAAFGQMGADERIGDALFLLRWIERTAVDHFAKRLPTGGRKDVSRWSATSMDCFTCSRTTDSFELPRSTIEREPGGGLVSPST
jgi:hypothetical protein